MKTVARALPILLVLAFVTTLSSPSLAKGKAKKSSKKTKTARVRVQLKKISSCSPKAPATQKVLVIKQWHLPPSTITKGFKEKYPQEKNQTAIYKALYDLIKGDEVGAVIAEGCEGVIDSAFERTFNGWSYESLKSQSQTKGYERILTSVPLKIAARFGDKIPVICGDADAGIQAGNLHLSNLRGWTGFLSRIKDNSNQERAELYAQTAAEKLSVPKTTPIAEIIPAIEARIRLELAEFSKSLVERNTQMVAKIKSVEVAKQALVVGGLHASDLRAQLEAAGLDCEVLEPPGYDRESEELIQNFELQAGPPPATPAKPEPGPESR